MIKISQIGIEMEKFKKIIFEYLENYIHQLHDSMDVIDISLIRNFLKRYNLGMFFYLFKLNFFIIKFSKDEWKYM